MNQSITIANTTIHQDTHGRFCLNDMHKAAGGAPKHRPSRWLENQQTKEAVEELSKAGIPALVSVHGGNARGTYVCRVLVYSYAMWISAKFYLTVIRTYDALMTEPSAVRPGQVEALARDREPALTEIPVEEYIDLLKCKIAWQETRIPKRIQGQTTRPLNDAEKAEILRLRAQGWAVNRIADTVGRANATVATYLRLVKGGAA